MNEGSGCLKEQTRLGAIIDRLSINSDERDKLINGIGDRVSRLISFSAEEPKCSETPKRENGVLSEIDSYIDRMEDDNRKLGLILNALNRIV